MLRQLFALGLIVMSIHSSAQKKTSLTFDHIEPPFWWTGMKNSSLQIMFHNKKINLAEFQVTVQYPGISLVEAKAVENNHYLFVTIEISGNAKEGQVPFSFTSGKKSYTVNYSLKPRSTEKNRIQGFDPSDVVYLIMPDRFANGDLKNDSVPGMFEGVHRNNPEARHGGDLKGISDHLGYLENLGVTTLWLNPVLENNQRKASYHGYAITDLYAVDKRFGTNADYVSFVNSCHDRGMKVIQDMVMNHIGNEHWLMYDLPEKDWVHQFPRFTRSNYRSTAVSDPYHAESDLRLMSDGWFDTTMPDVDQKNPLFATYLIQNTLWWIEYAGIDGIRMDTYPYNDKTFMARWCKEVINEYPSFKIVGEVWINDVATTAYWQRDKSYQDGYQSHLPSVTDFPLFFTLPQALMEEGGWDSGLARLYNLLCRDFIYPDPKNNLIFLDNHDLTRFFLLCGKDINKYKMALAFLLTTRGIPQLYYGVELLMDGDGGYHPNVRLDFPGGFPGDKVNAFTPEGRTRDQNEVFDYLSKLLLWRKHEKTIHEGTMTHYIPENNIYVYFRSYSGKVIMVAMNGNKDSKELATERFRESLRDFKEGKNVITGEVYPDIKTLQLPGQSVQVIELIGGAK
jgi:neopullulanase